MDPSKPEDAVNGLQPGSPSQAQSQSSTRIERQKQVAQQSRDLLDIVNKKGKISITQASDSLGIDKEKVNEMAEKLSQMRMIRVEHHYLKEPELESLEYKSSKPQIQSTPATLETETPVATVDRPTVSAGKAKKQSLEEYELISAEMRVKVQIMEYGDYVPHYMVSLPHIDFVTRALLDETKKALISEVRIDTKDVFDTDKFIKLKSKFKERAKERLQNVLKKSSEEYISTLSQLLVNEMVGLGDVEYLLLDNQIEEIVINSSKSPVWVYHKKHKWLKTNIIIATEALIVNYSSRVAREVGREITHLKPLLDAHLTTGDRVNATLAPISTNGNTMTIRRFSRVPWSMIYMIDPAINTCSSEVGAFMWMALEHELSLMVSGGTAAGKTSMLNALMPFMPASQRIISIEDTRELNLPEYLHWVPLTTREPNPEGEGGILMLDLLQNSLRMRPDRIIVGEVRAKREAEVLFEAMHTGHSVYSTFHAERAQEVIDRITSPPMSIPPTVMKSLHLIAVQYRNRRNGNRRVFEVCEILKDESENPSLNTLYKWDPRTDKIQKMYPSIRVAEELSLFTGMDEKEVEEDIMGKKGVLDWLYKQEIKDVNDVGRVVTEYYQDKEMILDMAQNNKPVDFL